MNASVEDTYQDTNGDWCCALSVICNGEIKHVLFVWDTPSGTVERLDDEGPMPGGLFITVRNMAKDTLRPLVQRS